MNQLARKPDSDPAMDCGVGFVQLNRTLLDDGVPFRVSLLVPVRVKEAIVAEERAAREKCREDEQRRAVVATASTQAVDSSKRAPRSVSGQAPAEAAAERQQQEQVWHEHSESTHRRTGKRWHQIFEPEEALKLFDLIQRYHRDDRERLQRVYDRLAETGHVRTVARPSRSALRSLAESQPHMSEVVEFIEDQLRLAAHARKPMRISPILLHGEPGIGKTHFAHCLAKALRAPVRMQPLDTDITGSLLLGSDRKWSTSQHGLLFDLIALGETANPVIALDEIDKANRIDSRVQSCLYSVLEPVSARRVRDISVDFEFDASLVTWIATANDVSRLDAPLRSRFKEFHISLPGAEQCIAIAREVVAATIRSASVPGFSLKTNRLECALAHLTAREIQQLVRQAIARALKQGRMAVEVRDLPAAAGGQGELDASTYLH